MHIKKKRTLISIGLLIKRALKGNNIIAIRLKGINRNYCTIFMFFIVFRLLGLLDLYAIARIESLV